MKSASKLNLSSTKSLVNEEIFSIVSVFEIIILSILTTLLQLFINILEPSS
jgi:hypothetical protein